MVYHGPSRGCMTCRRRKVRCDLGTPRCLKCIRRREPCSGPRSAIVETNVYCSWESPELVIGADGKAKAILPRSGSKAPSIQQPPSVAQNDNKSRSAQNDFQRQRKEGLKLCCPFDDASECYKSTSDPCERPGGASGRIGERHALIPGGESHTLPRAPPGGEYGNAFFGVFRVDSILKELVLFWSTSVVQQMPGVCVQEDMVDLASTAWGQLFKTLYDAGHGYAFLAVAASHYKTITGSPHMTVQEKRYHTTAIRLLRERLNNEHVSDLAMGYVKSMILAELASGDYRAATFHSKFLVRMFQTKDTSAKSPPAAICESSYVWCEMGRATKTFTKPLLDLDLYAQSLGRNSSYEQFEWTSNKASMLDSAALGDLGLIKLFAELNHYNTILKSFGADILPFQRETCIHLSNQLLLLHGRLLHYCIDNFSAVQNSAHLSETDRFRRTQHTAASLAALWWLRLRTRTESAGAWSSEIAVIERHSADGAHIHSLLERMLRLSEDAAAQTLLDDTDEQLTLATLSADFRLRLWTLHIGDVIERTAAFHEGRPKPTYCAEQLARYMEAAGLTEEMPAMRDMWNAFLPLDKGKMYGPQWLNPVLRLWGFMYEGPKAKQSGKVPAELQLRQERKEAGKGDVLVDRS